MNHEDGTDSFSSPGLHVPIQLTAGGHRLRRYHGAISTESVLGPHVNPWGLPDGDLVEGAQRAEKVLRSLAGAEVLVTGGTGFLGSWLVSSLACANELFGIGLKIVVISRRPAALPRTLSESVTVREADVRHLADVCAPDVIIHGATSSVTGPGIGGASDLISTICDGTAAVLQLAAATEARILFLSSGAVYGELGTGPATESDVSRFGDLRSGTARYGMAKLLAETLCIQAAADLGLGVVIARLFSFVGPRIPLDAHFAAGAFLADAVAGRSIRIKGDGTDVRSYLYSGDLPEWCWTLLVRGVPGTAYNVGSPDPITIAELARVVSGLVVPSLPVEILGRAAAGAGRLYLPDISKAQREFGLHPRTALGEAVSKTLIWLRDQPSCD